MFILIYNSFYTGLINIISYIIPVLLGVAFITIAERKTMASMQRRVGPNIVGFYGILQPFADALKLLIKEYIAPTQANIVLFFLGPIITLIFSLLGYAMIPYGPGIAISDYSLGILYILAVSSLATYGILLAGWSANSKYAFLGSLRSTAQLISYELILGSALLVIVFLTGTFNLSIMIEVQKCIWLILLIFPLYMIFFISSIAETNRAPFDLAEAESELVSGFMTEHAAGIFVFFFLAEYASIIIMCMLITTVLLAGYEIFSSLYSLHLPFLFIVNVINHIDVFILYTDLFFRFMTLDDFIISNILYIEYIINNILLSFFYTSSLSTKTYFIVFLFILVRASYPRLRFDNLMGHCWTDLLPTTISIIIYIPCIILINNSIINSNLLPF